MVNGADVIPSHVGLLEEYEPSWGGSGEEGLDDAVKNVHWRESKPCHKYPLVPEEVRIYYHPFILCN